MQPANILHDMPKTRTKQSNEEQAVKLKELEKLFQDAQANDVDLENIFDKYKQEVHSQTSAKKVKECEPDKTDRKIMTDAQSSNQVWYIRILSWLIPVNQKTEPDGDQNILKELERQMKNSLKKNTELRVSIQEKLQHLSQKDLANREQQNQDLLKKPSEVKETHEIFWQVYGAVKGIFKSEKQKVTIQLYCQQQADLVQLIMKELVQQLKSQCPRSIELKEIILEPESPINPDLPLMVICLHASRLLPDVHDAIKKIKSGPNVAVVIVHNKEEFALPTERSDEILLEEECSEIGAIIDVAYVAGKGMYTCNMNTHAIEELIKFIKRKGINNNKPQPHTT